MPRMGTMSDELDFPLDKIEDPILRAEILAQVRRLRDKRSFEFVFEDHLPERVRLPDHPIRRGTQVVVRDGSDDVYQVVRVRSGVATSQVETDRNIRSPSMCLSRCRVRATDLSGPEATRKDRPRPDEKHLDKVSFAQRVAPLFSWGN